MAQHRRAAHGYRETGPTDKSPPLHASLLLKPPLWHAHARTIQRQLVLAWRATQ